ncbi:hypothetical protein [Spirillospora sp. NBC_01491]|uniref:hypothetical protein n=1 Tax=Spirillospora sp. NBC_01491 TaxID=2976007 RepID=UPI002E367160|nr:hypothetical protein [Spirillospora sp. NBC_01491]
MTDAMTGVGRADPGMRSLRAAVFSTVCVALSALAHGATSGAGLPWWSLAGGWLLLLGMAVPAAGRERSRPAITAMLLCGQMFLHAVFSFGQCGTSVEASAAPPEGTLSAHASAGHSLLAGLMPGPAMFFAHLACAFVLGWVVHRGERTVWRLVRVSMRTAGVVTAPLAALLAAVFAPTGRAVPADARFRVFDRSRTDPPKSETVLLDHAVIRRGPPAVGRVS